MIITLCGSYRFRPWFKAWDTALRLAGHTVFGPTEKEKTFESRLDRISDSHAILVLNIFAYIGEDTHQEILHARILGKKIYVAESWGLNYGIGDAHNEATRRLTWEKYKVPKYFKSPIDATPGGRYAVRHCWDTELLGPAGSLRSELVNMIRNVEPELNS